MPKINSFPKKIAVTINKEDGDDHYLSSDADPSGAGFAEQGKPVKFAVYGLIEVREVSLTVTSTPAKYLERQSLGGAAVIQRLSKPEK